MTLAVAATATSVDKMLAFNRVLLTYCVVRADPFHSTFELATNPEPFTVRLNPAEPISTLDGDRDVITGVGLGSWTSQTPRPWVATRRMRLARCRRRPKTAIRGSPVPTGDQFVPPVVETKTPMSVAT